MKIGALGDVVMASPLLLAIKRKYPLASITWIVGSIAEPLLRASTLVEELLVVDEEKLFKGSIFQKLVILTSLWCRLAFRRFDLCLIAHSDPRYRVLALPIRCRERRFWSRKEARPIPGRYHAEEYIRLWTQSDEASLPEISFPSLSLPSLQTLKHAYQDLPWVVVAPGGAKNPLADDSLRRWPIGFYVELLKQLSTLPIHLFVTGAFHDLWVRPYLKDVSCIDLIGELDVLGLLSLLQESKLLVTHDSGPLHLAKMVRCPVIALFGPTQPEEKVGIQEDVHVLWKGREFSCSPCYDGKCYAPCQRNRCLEAISPQEVFEKALLLLSE
ncbi:MAG: glycosyltransferase family 9 protein [Chlamydiales bacterium]|nr:glycosyltransferase family 9 protein [Chlamydiales bacterium]